MTTEERTRALAGPRHLDSCDSLYCTHVCAACAETRGLCPIHKDNPGGSFKTDPGLPPFLVGETLPAQAADHPKFEPSLSKADYEAKIRLLEEEVEVLSLLLTERRSVMRALSEDLVEAHKRKNWEMVTRVVGHLEPK